MSNVLPTIGRVVYYHALGSADGKFPVGQNRAAIITDVLDAEKGTVSLCVLNPTGMYFNQSVEQGAAGGQWDWMPFQKDQQARLAPEPPQQQVA